MQINQLPNTNNQIITKSQIPMTGTLFGYLVIGIYLELACLPVGRGYGYWNFR